MMNSSNNFNMMNPMYNNNMMMGQINPMDNPMNNNMMMNPMTNNNMMMNPMTNNNMVMNPMNNNMMMNPMMNNNMMMNPMMNSGIMMNPMMNNNMMMNPMMNNNMMMNPMMNSGMVMNPMMNPMMDNMIMNPMMNQINNNNIEKRKINNSNNLDIYYNEKDYITSISRDIFSEKDDINIIRRKLISVYLKQKKKLYRPPYPEEIIERESPKETLEFLLNRGVMEKEPRIEFFVHPHSKFGFFGWNNITVIMGLIEKKKLNFKDQLLTKVNFEVPLRGRGLSGLEFVDLEKSKTKILEFSINAPIWRKACEGLNLFGNCIYQYCEAFNNEVIFPVGINVKFDLNKQKKEIICPICHKNFIPLTLGFWRCEYQIKGEKLKDGEYSEVNINGKETKDDNFEYFDANENGTAIWDELIIFACYRQKMKYKA